jgi:anti-sigma B factor antagonist
MTIAPEPFLVEVTSDPSGLVVRVTGELDVVSAPTLGACLLGLDADVVVDLADVTFIDSTGIATLVAGHNRALLRGRSFGLRSPTERVAKVLHLTGVDEVLNGRAVTGRRGGASADRPLAEERAHASSAGEGSAGDRDAADALLPHREHENRDELTA